MIQSYCELERSPVEKENLENPALAQLAQTLYAHNDELVLYYDDSLPNGHPADKLTSSIELLSESLTGSAVSGTSSLSPYYLPRPEHPTVQYLKEESRREVGGRLSSGEDNFDFDCEEDPNLSDLPCEKFSSNSSNDELFI